MPKTDLDHPPAESTPETQARTPWESIDPSEPAQAEPATGTRAQTSRPPAKFKPVRAKIRRGAAKQKSPFASTAISAAVAGMADFASEIQALVNSQQFNHEQEIATRPAESPEEQVVTQAFLSDESSDTDERDLGERGTGILPVSESATQTETILNVGRALPAIEHRKTGILPVSAKADSDSLAPVLGGGGGGEGPGVAMRDLRDFAETPLTPTLSPEYGGEGETPVTPTFSDPAHSALPAGSALADASRVSDVSETTSPFSGRARGALPVGSALADALRGSDATETASAKVDPTETPRFGATSIEPPIEPATINETPWATMDADDAGETVSPSVTAFVDIPIESLRLDRLETLDLSADNLDALDASDLDELTRGDLAMNRHAEADRTIAADQTKPESQPELADTIAIPQASTDDSAITFAMTDPVAASIPQMGIVSEPAPIEEERAGDAMVLVPERESDVEAEHAVTAPQLALEPTTESEPQWVLETEISPAPVTTGGTWTIPLMCLGIGLIACCMAIPQIDFNRRLRYEQRSLAANLESVQKQVAVNDEFLKKVMDDPTLAERLAGRQMKTMRKGQKVIPLDHVSDDGDMSPFALVAVAPPPEPPPYKPIRGTIANLCYDARSRLYLLGTAMGMVAMGLVMGFSPLRRERP